LPLVLVAASATPTLLYFFCIFMGFVCVTELFVVFFVSR
jgi:hypothetical protein